VAVRPGPATTLEQLLEISRRRVGNERAHDPKAYRPRQALTARRVTFLLTRP
jgi:hypothetical protein